MNAMKNYKLIDIIGICLFVSSIILLLIMLILGLNQSIWFDETFTLKLISMSFKDMIFATAKDVHPPLYYIILKVGTEFCSLFISSGSFNASDMFNSYYSLNIIVAKLISTIPLILLLYFSFTKLKKGFGWLTSGIFGFCIVTMPKMMIYCTQIRMYSWGIFFVTLSFYYCYKITEDPNKKNWIIFSIFSLMAIYTHYYATIAIGFIYLLLIYHIILKNRKMLKNWILSSVTIILVYIPWLLIFINESKYFNSNQWHVPTFQYLIDTIGFICSPIYDYYFYFEHTTILGILFFVSLLIFLIYMYFSRKKILVEKKSEKSFFMFIGWGGIFVLFVTTFFAIIFSVLVKPMFEIRYTILLLGCFWLSFAVLLSRSSSQKIIFVPIFFIILVIGMINFVTFIDSEINFKSDNLEFMEVISQINENDTIISLYPSGSLFDDFFKFYFKNNKFFSNENNFTIISEINERLKKGKIWILIPDGNEYEFNKLITENGLKLKGNSLIRLKILAPCHIYLINI
ncbi:MAG: glycosyltransferase family 39 protein [Methanobrevibacter sp.]|jgi:hypothetical protein|nr:glycosyltransferase family 39 protein [Candidatus Methanovirga meridionalis]